MFTVYNIICKDAAEVVATAKAYMARFNEVQELSLEEQRIFFSDFFTCEKQDSSVSFKDPYNWEDEIEGGIYNAIDYTPEEVEEYFSSIIDEEISYLDSLIHKYAGE